MQTIIDRLTEPSTFAGLGILCHAVGVLLTDPANLYAWGEALGAVGAILKREATQ